MCHEYGSNRLVRKTCMLYLWKSSNNTAEYNWRKSSNALWMFHSNYLCSDELCWCDSIHVLILQFSVLIAFALKIESSFCITDIYIEPDNECLLNIKCVFTQCSCTFDGLRRKKTKFFVCAIRNNLSFFVSS